MNKQNLEQELQSILKPMNNYYDREYEINCKLYYATNKVELKVQIISSFDELEFNFIYSTKLPMNNAMEWVSSNWQELGVCKIENLYSDEIQAIAITNKIINKFTHILLTELNK